MESTEEAALSEESKTIPSSAPMEISPGSKGIEDGMTDEETTISLSLIENVEINKEEEMKSEADHPVEEKLMDEDPTEDRRELSSNEENKEDVAMSIDTGDNGQTIESNDDLSKLSFQAPKFFHRFLYGKGGVTKKKVEAETDTKIMIPSKGKEGNIVITGSDKNKVLEAKGRLLSLMKTAKSRLSITHFISIPLIDESFKNGFLKFKEEVLKELEEDQLDEKLFQNANKLHLTIGVMICCDEDELKAASMALQDCKEKIVKPLVGDSPPRLSMAGLGFFGSSPAKTRVLYAKVVAKTSESLLEDLCTQINAHFLSEGIAKNERDGKVTIHATLMNLAYLRKKRPFDTTKIIEKFSNFEFGEGDMTRIDLSILHKVSENGYYKQADTIEIP